LIHKLEKITEVEHQVRERRHASKVRYQEILGEFKQKSKEDIQGLEEALLVERDLLLKNAYEEALLQKSDIDKAKDSEIGALKTQFDFRKEEVVKRIIQEVFSNGNR
jgi:vacuolar-type H+-ATPase subunit H